MVDIFCKNCNVDLSPNIKLLSEGQYATISDNWSYFKSDENKLNFLENNILSKDFFVLTDISGDNFGIGWGFKSNQISKILTGNYSLKTTGINLDKPSVILSINYKEM